MAIFFIAWVEGIIRLFMIFYLHRKFSIFLRNDRTFFTVVLLCQFLVLAGNRFWFYILMYLEYKYSCGVVLVFGSGGK